MGAKGLVVAIRPPAPGEGDMTSLILPVEVYPVGVTEPKERDDKSMPPRPPSSRFIPLLPVVVAGLPGATSPGEENVRVRLKLLAPPLPGRLPTTPGEDTVLARLNSIPPPSTSRPSPAPAPPAAAVSSCNKPGLDRNPGETDVSVTVLARRRYRSPPRSLQVNPSLSP